MARVYSSGVVASGVSCCVFALVFFVLGAQSLRLRRPVGTSRRQAGLIDFRWYAATELLVGVAFVLFGIGMSTKVPTLQDATLVVMGAALTAQLCGMWTRGRHPVS
jgi:hypothetical protein